MAFVTFTVLASASRELLGGGAELNELVDGGAAGGVPVELDVGVPLDVPEEMQYGVPAKRFVQSELIVALFREMNCDADKPLAAAMLSQLSPGCAVTDGQAE